MFTKEEIEACEELHGKISVQRHTAGTWYYDREKKLEGFLKHTEGGNPRLQTSIMDLPFDPAKQVKLWSLREAMNAVLERISPAMVYTLTTRRLSSGITTEFSATYGHAGGSIVQQPVQDAVERIVYGEGATATMALLNALKVAIDPIRMAYINNRINQSVSPTPES